MLDSDLVHLHLHSSHSLLDGLTTADKAMAAAEADGQHAIALTDHGSLGGTLKYAKAADEHGIKFLPGAELYLSIGDRHEQNHVMIPREDDFDGTGGDEGSLKKKIYEHLTVLAATKAGWHNLLELDNKSHDSFWSKPRADYELLAEHSAGLVAGTGCLGGPVAGQLIQGNDQQAQTNLARLVDIFGRDNVFVEVMDHGIPAERKIIPGLVRLAKQFDLPVVATNDSHYAAACDADAHDAWLAISASKGTKKVLVSDKQRFRFSGSGYHLRTAAEMHALFDNQPGTEMAVVNTVLIADMAENNIVLGSLPDHHLLPEFPVPQGHSVESWFHEQVRLGLIARYGAPLPQQVRERARHEETVIRNFGVVGYYLVVADLIARERDAGGIVGAGRGSGCGSICAYAMGITNIDPIENGLLFERFLNPNRKGLPDFDIDFQASRQYDVIRRAAQVYGADHAARIGTYGNAWAKDALKKMGRVLDKDSLANSLAAAVPDGDAKKWTLSSLLDSDNPMGAELRQKIASGGDEAKSLVEMALSVEGSASAETIHACGILISPEPLPGAVPMRRDRKNDNFPVTQWDAGDLESAGYVKFDFLAIKDLDVVATALSLIRDDTGEAVNVMNLRPDSPDSRSTKTREMLAAGRTAGVFQLASKGITELTMRIQPENHHDLSAILALYRPGPMGADMHNQYARRRRGGEPVDYAVYSPVAAEQEVIASVLDSTLGAIVMQEQLMQLAQAIADFAPGQMADLQQAFSKKKKATMDALYPVWLSGGQAANRADGGSKVAFRKTTLEGLWRTFEASASYLFNASHSYAYAMLSWQMAYLKANWPAQFGAALLEHTGKAEKRQQVLTDLISEGVEVLPPSVNTSAASTSVSAGAIVLGLAEIKDVGEAASGIIAEREAHGPFTSVAELVSRTQITSTAVQALAEAGALDEFGPRLGVVMACRALRVPGVEIPDTEWGVLERSARQRTRLGVAVGPHPLTELHQQIRLWKDRTRNDTAFFQVHNLPEQDVDSLNVIGVVAAAEERFGRGGKRLVLQLESAKARVEVVMWANRYAAFRAAGNPIPYPGQLVAVNGRLKATHVTVNAAADDDMVGDTDLAGAGDVVLNLYAERLDTVTVTDPVRPVPLPQVVLRCEDQPQPQATLPTQQEPAVDELPPDPGGGDIAAVEPSPSHLHMLHRCFRRRPGGLGNVMGVAEWIMCRQMFPLAAKDAVKWWASARDGDRFVLSSPDYPGVSVVLIATDDAATASLNDTDLPGLLRQHQQRHHLLVAGEEAG